jgi:hypothetical protein
MRIKVTGQNKRYLPELARVRLDEVLTLLDYTVREQRDDDYVAELCALWKVLDVALDFGLDLLAYDVATCIVTIHRLRGELPS